MTTTARRTAHGRTTGRTGLGTAALVLAAISALGLLLMIGGDLAGVQGFSGDSDSTLLADATWVVFAVSGVLALVVGAAAWVLGRRHSRPGDVRAGQAALAYVLLALVVTAIGVAVTT
jgi:hypothetical protein